LTNLFLKFFQSLNGYIDTLVNKKWDNNNNREELTIRKQIEWKPELNTLLRYGSWLTSTRRFLMDEYESISEMSKNFVEELLLHLTNSRFINWTFSSLCIIL